MNSNVRVLEAETVELTAKLGAERASVMDFVKRFYSPAANGIDTPISTLRDMGFEALASKDGVTYLMNRFAFD